MDSAGILCFRRLKERSDVGWSFLHPAQSAQNGLLHLRRAGDDFAAQDVVFQIVPDQFVGVQLRRVGRQEEQPQAGRDGFGKLSDHHGFVRGMPVDNQKDGLAPAVDQPLQVFDKDFRRHSPLHDGKMKLACPTHCGNQVHAEPGSRCRHDRRLAARRPGRAGMRVRPDPRFVAEKDTCLAGFSLLADAGILVIQPLRNGSRILLIGPPQGTLRTQPQLIHQASDGRAAQLNPELASNHDPNHVQRPQGKRETHLQGVLSRNRAVHPGDLSSGEFPRPTTPSACLQGLPSTATVHRKPIEDRRSADAQRLGHLVRRLTVLHTGYSAPPKIGQRFPTQLPRIEFHDEKCSIIENLCPNYFGKVSKSHVADDEASKFPSFRVSEFRCFRAS